ncbi:hypothetical protein F4859DRAFT_488420 [Xylaria cf. heliscus]|nr:hypothetical protein F4859DRAFT_488420 [Xylaria cf. heliscus]
MEPRSQTRHGAGDPSRPPTDHYQSNMSESESSDEDDDDIPAYKLPSISPSKPFTVSSTHSHANQAKRSLSDVAWGGIVLYPGSKKPRNGYNMTPVSREPLSGLTPGSSHAPRATVEMSPHTRSLSLSSESDVFEGLVSSVNDVFRRHQTCQAQDYTENQPQQARPPTSHQLGEVQPGEVEECAVLVGDQECGLPLTTPPLISCALLPNLDNLNGANEDVKPGLPAAPDEENQTEAEVQTQVDTVSLPGGDGWEVPKSPGEPSAPEDNLNATHQRPQPVTKRGRRPKFLRVTSMAELLPNSEPDTGKRKQGRPRKHYPRLRNETDTDYITRIARLQKKPIPCVLEQDAQLTRPSSPVRNSTNPINLIAANVPGKNSQGDDPHASTYVSGSTQGQESRDPLQPCYQTSFDLDCPQLAQQLDIRLKTEPEQDAARPENHTEPGTQAGSNTDEGNRGFGDHDNLSQHEPVHCDNDDNYTDSGTLSEAIDGFNTDSGNENGADKSSEDSFEHDVDVFNARRTRHAKDDELFEGPSDDDVLAIHLDHQPLRRLCKLLGNISWAGARGNWQWRYFEHNGAKTMPARALLLVLAKLERLYQATPKAPNLKGQTQFLRDHANMLSYYFHKIKILVEHIRTQRLDIPERNEVTQNTDSRKRKRMTRDLVLFVMPMLTHVLVSAWGLGGETWYETSFTSTAVELLRRTLSWIMLLHRRLLRELERCPLEEKPENHRQQQAWRRRNERRNIKREEIVPLLDDLFQVIAAAPDQLAETEVRAKKESQRRQQQLRRERQLKIEQKAAEEARRVAVAERKKRSLLSIHGIHYRLETPTASSSRPSPSVTLGSTEWSVEEQRLLFLRIQASFPACPDLNTLHWELNKTVAQTVAMTEHILGKMLAKVLIGYSVEERTAELRQIMRSSGVVGL